MGVCHAYGTKDIKRVTAILELANRECIILSDNRECIILSDNDEVAVKAKEKYDGFGKWHCYQDIHPESKELTGEDFIKDEILKKISYELSKKYPRLPEKDFEELFSNDNGKIYNLKTWLKSGKLDDQIKKILEEVKESIFDNLKTADITENYFDYLEKLAEKVKSQIGNSG